MTEKINSIGIVKESRSDENRAPIAPDQVSQIINHNYLNLLKFLHHTVHTLYF